MLPCPHCELDIEDAVRNYFYKNTPGIFFEMGCLWCKRAVSVMLDAQGEFQTELRRQPFIFTSNKPELAL